MNRGILGSSIQSLYIKREFFTSDYEQCDIIAKINNKAQSPQKSVQYDVSDLPEFDITPKVFVAFSHGDFCPESLPQRGAELKEIHYLPIMKYDMAENINKGMIRLGIRSANTLARKYAEVL